MPQDLDFSWVYDLPPLQTFWMVTRLDHLERKAEYLGHKNHSVVELREKGGVFRSITKRDVEVDLPWWIPKWARPRSTITQSQLWDQPAWDGARRYATTVDVGGLSVHVRGEGRLTPVEFTSTRYDIHLDVRSTIPFLSRKIQRFVGEQLTAAIEGEHEFRLLWIKSRGGAGSRL